VDECSMRPTSWSQPAVTPNTDGIGLERAGIELDARGYVVVSERLETTAPACGR
jgi:hypothetical protein